MPNPTVTLTNGVTFEMGQCGRCGGTGRYESKWNNGRCFDCHGSGRTITRAGRAARRRYDAVMAEMGRTWADVQTGDVVYHNANGRECWVTVISSVDSANVFTVVDGQRVPCLEVEFVEGDNTFVIPNDSVRVWDRAVFVKACRAVSRFKGATVNLPQD